MFSNTPKGYALKFQQELIKYSVSTCFLTAKTEWNLISTHISEKCQKYCICSKDIIYIHTIYNFLNKNTIEIGCDCAKHITEEMYNKCKINQKIVIKIAQYIKKQDKDLYEIDFLDFRLSHQELTTILSYNVINDFECNFIQSIYNFIKKYKKLSDKQNNLYKKIMVKIVKNLKK
jgi:hypothetical protein